MKNDMTNNEPEKMEEMERRIDRALASYVEAEPSSSLEYRVLESVHHAAHRKSRLWWWAVATPLLATTLLVILLHPTTKVDGPSFPPKGGTSESIAEKSPSPSIGESGKPPTSVGTPSVRSKGGTSESIASIHSKGWLTGIPQSAAATTSDLTLHDAALVKLVREKPDQLRALFTKTDPEPIVPVRIDGIEIKPITTDELR